MWCQYGALPSKTHLNSMQVLRNETLKHMRRLHPRTHAINLYDGDNNILHIVGIRKLAIRKYVYNTLNNRHHHNLVISNVRHEHNTRRRLLPSKIAKTTRYYDISCNGPITCNHIRSIRLLTKYSQLCTQSKVWLLNNDPVNCLESARFGSSYKSRSKYRQVNHYRMPAQKR